MMVRLLIALLLASVVLTGCNAQGGAVNNTLASWKKDVEQYVTTQGHGDLNSLRDADVVDGRREFGAVTTASGGTDVTGVLLGRRTVANRDWMFYLVGVVKENSKLSAPLPHDTQVKEIHLVAVANDGGGFTWAMSQDNENTAAVKRYTAAQTHESESSARASGTPKRGPATLFPSDEDSFSLQIAGNIATATVQPSGATWTLALPAKP